MNSSCKWGLLRCLRAKVLEFGRRRGDVEEFQATDRAWGLYCPGSDSSDGKIQEEREVSGLNTDGNKTEVSGEICWPFMV